MYHHERTTFAARRWMPPLTSEAELLSLYLAHCEEKPRFRIADLERHVLAIDVRRFPPELIEEMLEGLVLSPSFWELEQQLDGVLCDLLEVHGDPTLWTPLLHHMPPLITTEDLAV